MTVKEGIEYSSEKFILVMDADFPYPKGVLIQLTKKLLTSLDSSLLQGMPAVHQSKSYHLCVVQ